MKRESLISDDSDPLGTTAGNWLTGRQIIGRLSQQPALKKSFPVQAYSARTIPAVSSFPIGKKTDTFRKRYFPHVPAHRWNDWHWQWKHRITNFKDLMQYITLTDKEQQAVFFQTAAFPLAVTPYYLSLFSGRNKDHPLRRAVIPSADEHVFSRDEDADPLKEDTDSPVHGLVHRYPDRALFLVTDVCSTYCRYCTRSRLVGGNSSRRLKRENWQKAIDYIQATPQIRDVLLSGGDPLTLPDDQIAWLLSKLRRIRHVEIVRIGTKVPAVLPQRITPKLVDILKKYHPLWMSLHFTHGDELTPETRKACEMLANAGIPLGSQTVLLSGINDSVDAMKALFLGLLKARVRPYYLYQCDPILGSGHFRTPVEKGLEIIKGLRGHITGYGVPHYVIDAPGGGGKIPLLPEYSLGKKEGGWMLKNYEDRLFLYPETDGSDSGYQGGAS